MFISSAKPSPSISRKSLAWFLGVQVFILAPHFFSVPIWIALVWLVVAFWRWQIFQGAWSYPGKLVKTLFVLVCCVGLVLSLGVQFSFQSMVSLLAVGFILKLLEMKTQKDFVLLIFIALFILATLFIEISQFLIALYGFFCLVLLCATLMQLYKQSAQKNIWQELRPSLYILLQAIPLMIVLFVAMPRLGSFWAVPSPQKAKTGLSDSMSPGDFNELMKSDALAFRVVFTGDAPAHYQLYWRSLIFSQFDGRRWSQSKRQLILKKSDQLSSTLHSHIDYLGNEVTYEVIAEPSGMPWLYTLAAPKNWSNEVMFARDMHLQAYAPVTQRMNYHVTSSLNYSLHEIDQRELTENLALPATGNLQTREQAKAWREETGSTEKLIEKLFTYYSKSFFYTLQPPSLGANVIDEFLWQSRQGFCEHFASSFVFFMRAAGIPARVVVGYQGGEINSVEGYFSIRQRDAHAWAEVWLDERGWVMFDPTGAVAPERIQKGIEASLSSTDQQLLGKPFGSSFKVLLRIREQWDALNFQWTRWVMNYDSDLQSQLLSNLLKEVSPWRIAMLIIAVAAISIIVILASIWLGGRRVTRPRSVEIYGRVCKKLAACGFQPAAGETPGQFLLRVGDSRQDLKAQLVHIFRLYEQFTYAESHEIALELQRQVARLKV